MEIAVGDWIRCCRTAPSKGTWPSYDQKIGRVIVVNDADKEIGVKFTANSSESLVWFLPEELATVARPDGAPNIRVHFEKRGN